MSKLVWARKGCSEPAATNAPVEDEAVEVVLGMNQKHILPSPKFLTFSVSSLPQNFSLLPTSLLLTSPLLPPSPLITSVSPLYPPTSPHFAFTPSLELGRAWSGSQDRARAGARTGQSKSLKVSYLPSLHFSWLFFSLVLLQQRRRR